MAVSFGNSICHDALPLGAILGGLSCPRSIPCVGVVPNLLMTRKAGGCMTFINLGVGSKGARYRNRSLDGFRVLTDEAKSDIQPRYIGEVLSKAEPEG